MQLDVFTILFLMASISLLAAFGFGVGWLRQKSVSELGLAACTFALIGLGAYLHLPFEHVPALIRVDLANTMFFVALALGWNAFRLIDSRRFLILPLVLPGVFWLMLCRVPSFHEDATRQIVVASFLISLLFLGYVHEFRRSSSVGGAVRVLLLVSAGGNVVVFAARGVYALVEAQGQSLLSGNVWMALSLAIPLVFITGLTFGGLWLWQARAVGLLQHEVEIDPLTGILNRRAFERGGWEMLNCAARQRKSTALLLFDIDHFKSINDQLGHLAGDHVLRELARLVKRQLRKNDLLARYGGEEFVLLLDGAHLGDAVAVADKLRALVAETPISWQSGCVKLTVSIGVAATQGKDCSLLALFAEADNALYCAKHAGRNRVTTASTARGSFRFKPSVSKAE